MPTRPKRQAGKWTSRVLLLLVLILLAPAGLMLVYRVLPPPVTPLMVIRLFEGEGLSKDWITFDAMSPHVPAAVIALEDNTFCEHSGFDWGSIHQAIADYYRGRRLRGASTISMQTTKNVFLWPQRNMVRKALEAPLTVLLEALWDKQRILEVYLNVVEWGPGIYGIEAAARASFGKPASALTQRESALLAAVLPNPRKWSPRRPTRYLERQVRLAKTRVRKLGPLLDCAR